MRNFKGKTFGENTSMSILEPRALSLLKAKKNKDPSTKLKVNKHKNNNIKSESYGKVTRIIYA
jgi:hypothetical protein